MDVHIEVLTKGHSPRALLEENGWRVAEDGADHLTASHPDVGDQPAARDRLHMMGLLTSVRLRIEFGSVIN